jgi:mannitol 2-dehydrogenase
MNQQNKLVSVRDAWTLPHVATYPRYDRSKLDCGIAHIGVGNFHRAHQALFVHEYLQTHPGDWMIHGVGLREADANLIEAMNSQNNLYTLTERSGSHDTCKVIGSIKECSYAPPDPGRVIQLLASEKIKIVSLTITEKGYGYDAAGDLDRSDPLIQADLVEDSVPRSALGYLYAASRERMLHHGSPFTIMSCDNLPGNGDLTRKLLLQFAELKDRAVARWIRDNTTCPNSMVDRITPAVTPETLDFVRNTFGIDDRCPVVSEAYLQWVLEDTFIAGRPQLEMAPVPVQLEAQPVAASVQFTGDVELYEKLKVRVLNGSHSALAYVAYLMGITYVDDAMRDPTVGAFVGRYMDEVAPTVPRVPGVDITAYKATLVQRFSNPAIRDQVRRLAEDGSKKIRNFVVPPLEDRLSSGGSIQCIAFALAAWFRYLRGVDERGAAIDIVDPMKDVLTARVRRDPHDPIHLLAVQEVFGQHVAANNRVVSAVKDCLDAIDSLGTQAALSRLLEQP